MAGQQTRSACSVGPCLVKLTDQSMQWMQCGRTVNVWTGKTVQPRTSVPLLTIPALRRDTRHKSFSQW